MLPTQFATAECANWDHGACKGIHFDHEGHITGCRSIPSCLLKDRKRCSYFEACVAPMTRDPVNAANVAWMRERDEAVRIYAKWAGAPKISTADINARLCPKCLRAEIPPRTRFCPECREKQRLDTYHRQNSRK